ncbi:MAG: M56 family metallopeptidase, partial [Clostridia bacterium]|nr:M56 family metallopeptidase [Clostridia bacterium]
MSDIFLNLLNISLTAGWLILAVILLRFLLKKAPKTVNFILWALVAIRLICPFSLQSALSLIPSAEPVHETMISQAAVTVDSGISAVDENVNEFIDSHINEMTPVESRFDVMTICGIIWAAGFVLMLMFFAFSFIRIKRQTAASINVKERIWMCDDISSPFILGVIRPKIYIPSGMDEEQMEYVISHEKAHLKHLDQWWKPLGFLLLSVYWFNPLMWAAYLLLCKDIELACDERVIKNMSKDSVAGYSQALLDCVSNKRTILSCPVAFGEVATKERVKKVLNYKKPTFWIIIVAIIASVIVAVCFMTNPVTSSLKFIDTETKTGAKVIARFGDEYKPEKLLKDVKNIDLYYKEPDYKSLGLTEKVEEDKESS